MTLEQINNRQEQLNVRLAESVINSKQVVGYITGEYPPEDDRKEMSYPSGLLNQLAFLQDKNEILIQDLESALRTLCLRVYAPHEPIQTEIKGK